MIGALLLLALLYLMVRSSQRPGVALIRCTRCARSGGDFGVGIASRAEMIARVFAREDFDYVTSSVPEDICRMFLRERRKIARSWVSMVEKQILALRRFHRIAARQHSGLSFRAEAALAFDFATLLLACQALQVLLYLRGPFAAPRIVGATVAAATRVCEASKQSMMAFLNPASIRSGWARALANWRRHDDRGITDNSMRWNTKRENVELAAEDLRMPAPSRKFPGRSTA